MDQKTYTQEQYNELEVELELLKMTHEKNFETYLESLTKINKLELQSKKMLEILEKVLTNVDWSYENWRSTEGQIIEEEIKKIIKESKI